MVDTALDDALRAVFDRLPVGIVVIRLGGERVYYNPRMQELFGYVHAHVDEWWADAYPDPGYRAEVRTRWEERVAAAVQAGGGPVLPDVYRVRCADGTDKWAEILGVVVEEMLYVLLSDVTEARDQQAALRAESSFRAAIIDAAADGICVCHAIAEAPHVRFTVWSERMTEITGYTMAEINEHGWYQSLYRDPEVRARAIARMDRMRLGDNLVAEEWTITRKDGEAAVLAISTSLIPNGVEEPHVLGLMQDRTEQRRAEEARKRLETQMQHAQKLESLGLLAGGIAHDFNNLLVAIMGQADLALEDLEPNSPARERLLQLMHAAERAAELTNQMLAYAGKGTFVVGPVDVNGVVREMTKLLAGSAARHIEVRLDLAPDLPPIRGDASQLRQVVLNLVTNAAEAMEPAPGTLTIESRLVHLGADAFEALEPFGAASAGPHVRLAFRDTGIGMDEATCARIFDPFYSTKFSGRGLGLAAVQGIIAGHGGGLRVTSEPGVGTTMEVLLPTADKVESPAEVPVAQRGSVSRGKVLLVDDEAQVRRIAREMLVRSGFRVVEAGSGTEALERFGAESFVAVVLDLTMPVVDGRAVLRGLRAQAPDVPVVLVSGYAEVVVADALEGHTRFLQKPFTRASLVRAIAQATESPTAGS